MRRDRVTLYAEEGVSWPLWGPNGLLPEDALPVSAEVRLRIAAWLNAYDGRAGSPVWTAPAGSSDEEDEELWAAEGEAICQLLEDELGIPVDFEA